MMKKKFINTDDYGHWKWRKIRKSVGLCQVFSGFCKSFLSKELPMLYGCTNGSQLEWRLSQSLIRISEATVKKTCPGSNALAYPQIVTTKIKKFNHIGPWSDQLSSFRVKKSRYFFPLFMIWIERRKKEIVGEKQKERKGGGRTGSQVGRKQIGNWTSWQTDLTNW